MNVKNVSINGKRKISFPVIIENIKNPITN